VDNTNVLLAETLLLKSEREQIEVSKWHELSVKYPDTTDKIHLHFNTFFLSLSLVNAFLSTIIEDFSSLS
jgi:hypothetical protein